jgi:hypothetical protein
MELGIDVCAFPELAPITGYNYGCRCARCGPFRKRYDGRRPNKPRRRDYTKGASAAIPAPPPKRRAAINPRNVAPYMGPCRCAVPNPQFIPIFGGHECANCGMPIRKESS